MRLPFTTEQFLSVFQQYNTSVFPMQILFYLIAGVIAYLLIKRPGNSDKIINASLAFFWLWMGIMYHLVFFTAINQAAYLFGILFIIQGLLFIYSGLVTSQLQYSNQNNIYSYAGWIFIIFALFIYPLLGTMFGHPYPKMPTFGLPCPTTIFTFGIFLFSVKKLSIYVYIIPLLWSIIGFGAALNLSIIQDYGLILAGLLGSGLILSYNKKMISGITA
ncbi:MAG: DUF6064 family protein [Ignavibacteriales bacterium]